MAGLKQPALAGGIVVQRLRWDDGLGDGGEGGQPDQAAVRYGAEPGDVVQGQAGQGVPQGFQVAAVGDAAAGVHQKDGSGFRLINRGDGGVETDRGRRGGIGIGIIIGRGGQQPEGGGGGAYGQHAGGDRKEQQPARETAGRFPIADVVGDHKGNPPGGAAAVRVSVWHGGRARRQGRGDGASRGEGSPGGCSGSSRRR